MIYRYSNTSHAYNNIILSFVYIFLLNKCWIYIIESLISMMWYLISKTVFIIDQFSISTYTMIGTMLEENKPFMGWEAAMDRYFL